MIDGMGSRREMGELRKAMHDFIDYDLNLNPLADEDLKSELMGKKTDVENVRKLMHWIAQTMDLHNIDAQASDRIAAGSSESASEISKALYVGNHFFELCTKASSCLTVPRSLQHRLIWETRHRIALENRELLRFHHSEWSFVDTKDRMEFLQHKALEYRNNMLPEREQKRDMFLETAALPAPSLLRLIDIEATCLAKQVMLVDYWADASVREVGYTAISHTFGADVYKVFDCQCTTKCSANVSNPRCSDQPCPHVDADDSATKKHNGVVNDILQMCANLLAAGVQYTWHDGVCIKQCDDEELRATIECMGWIYSNAKETIVFLHYVGTPMAPLRNGDVEDDLICRWQTRVWTLQEAALSKCRRYCVRVGTSTFGDCQNLEEFERKIDLLYNDETSKIEVIEEQRFCEILLSEIGGVLEGLFNQNVIEIGKVLESFPIHSINEVDMDIQPNWLSSLKARIRMARKACTWSNCIFSLYTTLLFTCFQFPTAILAMDLCSRRDSKHVGDRINSILALTGVKNFVADKHASSMETSIIEFFKGQGRKGLELAVFTANELFTDEDKIHIENFCQHTWLPCLWVPLVSVIDGDSHLKYRVLDNGMVELEGELLCVEVEFTVNLADDAGEGESSSAIVEVRPSNAHTADQSLALVLTRLGVSFTVAFPQTPECPIGRANIPSFHIRQTCRFRAHLVMPMHMESICPSSEQSLYNWPMLLVQGDLHSNYVEKMGCLKLSHLFVAYAKQALDRPFITLLKKLIIK